MKRSGAEFTKVKSILLLSMIFSLGESAWFRGNTHTHTVLSGHGEWQPDEVATWYYEHDYDFLCLTEHNQYIDPAGVSGPWGDDFILVGSEEVTGGSSVHTSGINTQASVGSEVWGAPGSLNEIVAAHVQGIYENGGLAILNHPNFAGRVPMEEMAQVENLRHFELYNSHPSVNNDGGADFISTEAIWDSLLTRGKLIYGASSDDSHRYVSGDNLPGKGWIMVEADELDAFAIAASMELGNYYSSRGVMLENISLDNWTLNVAADEEATLAVLDPGVTPNMDPHNITDENLTEGWQVQFIGPGGEVLMTSDSSIGEYRVTNQHSYVRAKVTYTVNESGSDFLQYFAWTQPVFTDMRDGKDTSGIGDTTTAVHFLDGNSNQQGDRISFGPANQQGVEINLPAYGTAQQFRLTLFDVSGKIINSIIRITDNARGNTVHVTWNEFETGGFRLAGLYYVQLESGKQKVTRRLLLGTR